MDNRPQSPSVTLVVPNYNHALYLAERSEAWHRRCERPIGY